ncbi:MAG: protein kinase domain-containing protein [Steroidobacteraceae bacterium]
MPIPAEHLAALSPLLDEGLDLSDHDREQWLDSLPEPFLGAKAMLRKMLDAKAGGQGGNPLDTLLKLALSEDQSQPGADTGTFKANVQIGNYRLERLLGVGGMGSVWLAEQTAPVRRFVALKLIRAGMYDENVVQRFQLERQSLALMDHPAIAKVFEAGTTAQGQPYFVMEYVPGLPITEYCDHQKLTVRDRIELFIQVCEGVQHAHQKAIIHRDLKPANILIVEVDGRPAPRIIDFGVARSVTPRLSDQTQYTQFGQFIGTPGYMSPEQMDPNILDIDTRTDVYSLGVILYVLLTGFQPFEKSGRQRPPLDEWLRQLREEEPPSLSVKLNADRETGNATAAARSMQLKQLVSLLRGDLDWITMKALERDRDRRYGAPTELAADIRRYLNNEPVVARPPSLAYRTGKFVKRNTLALAVAAVFALVIVAGAVAIVREARIARAEQARAEQRFQSLRKLTNSLLFEFHDAIENLPGSTAARELVVRRALEYLEQIELEGHNDPATLRDLAAGYERIGRIRAEEGHPHLGGTGSFQRANELYEKALVIRRNLVSADPRDPNLQIELLGTMLNLARMSEQFGDLDRALALQQQRLEIEQRLAASHDSEDLRYNIAASLIGLGEVNLWLGNYETALDYERRSLAMNQALLAANPDSLKMLRGVWRSRGWTATVLRFDRKFAEGAAESRKALAISEQLAARDPNNSEYQRFLIVDDQNLCECLAYAGASSEVPELCQKAISINEAMVKSDKNNVQASADLANSNMTMGLALYLSHAPREALVFERRADAMYREVAEHEPDSEANALDHAVALIYAGRTEAELNIPDQARKDLEQAQTLVQKLVASSPKHRYIKDTLDEARAALNALPKDSAPLAVH